MMVKVSRAGMLDEEALLLDDGQFTSEQLGRLMAAKGSDATSRELRRMAKEKAAAPPATGCNPEPGGEVIYLANARPRVRTRSEGPGGRVMG